MPQDSTNSSGQEPNNSSPDDRNRRRPQGKLAVIVTIGVALIGAWLQQQNKPPQPVMQQPSAHTATSPSAPVVRAPKRTTDPELSATPGSEASEPPANEGVVHEKPSEPSERGPLANRLPPKSSGKQHAGRQPDSSKDNLANDPTKIPNVTVYDQRRNVVFQGTVDLQPTLDRIEAGDRLPYSHDGIVFENRERRLPQKPHGYYKEFVHLTPKVSGPGAQRIVMGQRGEIYYTHDHYKTFQEIVLK